jgi:hypothetical protein
MVVLENDTISKSTFEATAKLLKLSMLHRWLRTNSLLSRRDKTSSTQTSLQSWQRSPLRTDVWTLTFRRSIQTSILSCRLSTMDERLDSDIQALKVIEGRVDQQQTVTSDLTNKMNRLKFDDRNDTFYVCGANEYDCKQLAFVPRVPEVPGIAEGSRSSAAKPSRRCTTATRVASCDITRTRRSRTRGIKLEQVVVGLCGHPSRCSHGALST